jgi:N utilization substance protein B
VNFEIPSIPVKVTLNEYLELAKEYSTPKSSILSTEFWTI